MNNEETKTLGLSLQAIDCINMLYFQFQLDMQKCINDKDESGVVEAIAKLEGALAEFEFVADDADQLVIINPPQLMIDEATMAELQSIQGEESKKLLN